MKEETIKTFAEDIEALAGLCPKVTYSLELLKGLPEYEILMSRIIANLETTSSDMKELITMMPKGLASLQLLNQE